MAHKIVLDPKAILDIQKAIDYYDDQQIGLGLKFERNLDKHFTAILKNPFYQVRYDDVHCLPVKKFPFMIHFIIENEIIRIVAVFHTSLSPDENWGKR
jgi:toxin ParE1/3/4